MAGQGGNPGGNGQHNRSHRPRPWPFPPRPWLVRARPWAGPPRPWAHWPPEPGAHGRIADGGGPKTRLETT